MTFIVAYDESLLRRAIPGFLFRRLGPGVFVALGGLVVVVAWMWARGERGALFGALAAVAALCVVLVLAVFREHRRRAIESFRRLKALRATFEVGDDAFTVSSDHGSFTMPWSSVSEVRREPDYWLLVYEGAQFTLLPTAGVPAEALEQVARRVETAAAARRAAGKRASAAGPAAR
ncbi:MAG TPA: YcxB family protein [Planctomycetota bacterium]|nr:YcxB family protein [Planctomycetota bacterium]